MLAQDYDGGEAIIQEALRLFRKVGLTLSLTLKPLNPYPNPEQP